MPSKKVEWLASSIHDSELHDRNQDMKRISELTQEDYEGMTTLEFGFVLNLMCQEIIKLRKTIEIMLGES